MMNHPGHAAADPWCYRDDDAGEAAAASSSFADLIADYSTDDLFDLACCRPGGTMLPAAADVWTPPLLPDVRFDPPSEDQMAAWLRVIVEGEDLVAINDGGGRQQTADGRERPSDTSSTTAADKKEKLPTAEGMGSTHQEMRKLRVGGSSRRSHHGETHNLIEKRRRNKINERFRTLQQLVPGCDDKSNQAATLDQTIEYMRSLQDHVKAMSCEGPSRPPPPPYPVVQPQYVRPPVAPAVVPMPAAPPMMVLAPAPAATTMVVPFGVMVQLLPHYPPAAVMMPAAAAPLYPAAAASAAIHEARAAGR